MKIYKTILLFIILTTTQISFAQIDLAIGNLNAGYTSYNSTTGVISGVYFDALNNGNGAAGAFRIALFLVDPNNFNNNYEVYSTNVTGQSGNTLVVYNNINVNFNNSSGIPAGNYRLVVSIDEDNVVVETDETNNALYITQQGNNLIYNPISTNVYEAKNSSLIFSNYPNPASSSTIISYEFTTQAKNASIIIRNINGAIIRKLDLERKQDKLEISVAELPSGIYFYSLVVNEEVIANKKLIVTD